MKILMFGWEFPPHISGGLGTACYGLTKGLAGIKDVEILFVVPKVFGDEETNAIQLIGANEVPVMKKEIEFADAELKIESLAVNSTLIPYTNDEEFWQLLSHKKNDKSRFIKTTHGYTIDFSGTYGPNLIEEIKNYAVIAEIIAQNNSFDLIHAHDWLAYPAGIAAKTIAGKPLIIHVHATDFDRSGGNVNPVVYAIEREGMETADKIIAVSNYTKQILIDKYFVPAEKITTIYNAVEPETKTADLNYKKGLKEKVVTFLGRITL
ncbi:MAG: glycosyltransferase family 4 protein, partial [Mariniphaga sp.]